MNEGPPIARIAGLIGEPARAQMLSALMAGQALTATELAAAAGVTKQTASAHLARLLEARLLSLEVQGRHRYFRLADADVAALLEGLMGVAVRTGAQRLLPGPREPALRAARQCYDHLAGDAGVQLYEGLLARGLLHAAAAGPTLTAAGRVFFESLQIDLGALEAQRRPLCRHCLDWSVRRHHLAGSLGAALLARLYAKGWARRAKGTRVVTITPPGEAALRQRFYAPLRALA